GHDAAVRAHRCAVGDCRALCRRVEPAGPAPRVLPPGGLPTDAPEKRATALPPAPGPHARAPDTPLAGDPRRPAAGGPGPRAGAVSVEAAALRVRVREDADRLPRRLVRSAGADRQRGAVDRDRAFMAGRPGRFQRNPTEISLVLKWDDLKVVPYSDDLKVVPYSDGRNLELKIRNLECNRFSR